MLFLFCVVGFLVCFWWCVGGFFWCLFVVLLFVFVGVLCWCFLGVGDWWYVCWLIVGSVVSWFWCGVIWFVLFCYWCGCG